MRLFSLPLLSSVVLLCFLSSGVSGTAPASAAAQSIFGFRDAATENANEAHFLAVPDPKLAEEHLRVLTQAPHMAGTPEDKATADYVAQKFRDAGLETEIVEYKVWMNYPQEISVDITAPAGVEMHGPTREHVEGDPYDNDPRVVMPFSGMSPSGDAEADVVYANYGTPEDFEKLEKLKIDVRGKIVIVRYGQNFRGVKEFIAQEHGAAGVIIYSDPFDDGWRRGDKYPEGPWRPDTGVQRGSVGYMFEFPGDPTTPGIASVPSLPESKRISPEQSAQMPKVPVTPLSYHDAWPILQHLGGPDSPREWQGALPFTYHLGPGPVRVKMHLKQDYQFRTLWDVIGRVRGSESPDEWVVAGNHRDAWVYGAVDPNSGTAAMLEAVHGVGELLKSGWKPKRTMIFASWDGEEEGLMGSTEWAEQHESELGNAPAYFNVDVAVSGPKFGASAVPSLKQFLRDLTKAVPSPKGGTVYEAWQKVDQPGASLSQSPSEAIGDGRRMPGASARSMFRWEIWAAVPTTARSSSTWACLLLILVPAVPTACTIRRLTISPGSKSSAIRISFTNRKWREFLGWKLCAWPTLTCCLTTMRNMARRLPLIWTPRRNARRTSLGIMFSISAQLPRRQNIFRMRERKFFRSREIRRKIRQDESCAARRRAGVAGAGRTAPPSVVSPCDLCSGGIYGVCGGGDSRSE